MTSGQVASIVLSSPPPRGVDARRDAVGGEHADRAPGTSVSESTNTAPRSRELSTTCLLCTISLRTYTGVPCNSSARSTVCTARSTPAQYPRGVASSSFSDGSSHHRGLPHVGRAARQGTLGANAAASPRPADTRSTPRSCIRRGPLSHMHIGGLTIVEGPAADDGGVPRADPCGACTSFRATATSSRHTAIDSGRPVWV